MVSAQADVQVTWPTARGPRRELASLEARQADYHHEMLVLTYYAEPITAQRYRSGTPLVARWGVFPNKVETFYGTVLYVQANLENNKHALRVVCIGASYPQKEHEPEAFNNLSVEQVISLGMRKAGLSLVRPTRSLPWPLLVRHAEESVWAFYVRLAKRMGYTWFVNRTTGFLYDPIKTLLANSQSFPVLTYHYGQGNDFTGDILSFTPVLGDQGVPGHEVRESRLLAVDPRSLAVIGAGTAGKTFPSLAAVREPARFTGYLDTPAHSVEEAVARVNGEQSNIRWRYQVEAVAYGNARVRQGTGVHIDGVDAENNGLWYVQAARHEVSKEDHAQQWRYIMRLTLVRDSHEIRAVAPPSGRTLRSLHPRHDDRSPAPVWKTDRWVSLHPTELVLP